MAATMTCIRCGDAIEGNACKQNEAWGPLHCGCTVKSLPIETQHPGILRRPGSCEPCLAECVKLWHKSLRQLIHKPPWKESSSTTKPVWEHLVMPNSQNWRPFRDQANMEAAFADAESNNHTKIVIHIDQQDYEVDFKNMTRTNLRTQLCARIQRRSELDADALLKQVHQLSLESEYWQLQALSAAYLFTGSVHGEPEAQPSFISPQDGRIERPACPEQQQQQHEQLQRQQLQLLQQLQQLQQQEQRLKDDWEPTEEDHNNDNGSTGMGSVSSDSLEVSSASGTEEEVRLLSEEATDLPASHGQPAEVSEDWLSVITCLQNDLLDEQRLKEEAHRLSEEAQAEAMVLRQRWQQQEAISLGLENRLAQVECLLNEQRTLSETWRQLDQFDQQTPVFLRPPLTDTTLSEAVQAMLRGTTHTGRGSCRTMAQATVTRIQHLTNHSVWKSYTDFRNERRRRIASRQVRHADALRPRDCELISNALPWVQLDDSLNEVMLLHGTASQNLDAIVRDGLDERVAGFSGLYGAGIYFSDKSCKCFQYCRDSGERCMIVARVVLGHPFITSHPLRGIRQAPPNQHDTSRPFESVIANPGIQNGGGTQCHREFVVFAAKQVYPELVVWFTTP